MAEAPQVCLRAAGQTGDSESKQPKEGRGLFQRPPRGPPRTKASCSSELGRSANGRGAWAEGGWSLPGITLGTRMTGMELGSRGYAGKTGLLTGPGAHVGFTSAAQGGTRMTRPH